MRTGTNGSRGRDQGRRRPRFQRSPKSPAPARASPTTVSRLPAIVPGECGTAGAHRRSRSSQIGGSDCRRAARGHAPRAGRPWRLASCFYQAMATIQSGGSWRWRRGWPRSRLGLSPSESPERLVVFLDQVARSPGSPWRGPDHRPQPCGSRMMAVAVRTERRPRGIASSSSSMSRSDLLRRPPVDGGRPHGRLEQASPRRRCSARRGLTRLGDQVGAGASSRVVDPWFQQRLLERRPERRAESRPSSEFCSPSSACSTIFSAFVIAEEGFSRASMSSTES